MHVCKIKKKWVSLQRHGLLSLNNNNTGFPSFIKSNKAHYVKTVLRDIILGYLRIIPIFNNKFIFGDKWDKENS